jgi:hypothetical protein
MRPGPTRPTIPIWGYRFLQRIGDRDLNSSRFRLMRIGVRINSLLFSRKASLPARDSFWGLG